MFTLTEGITGSHSVYNVHMQNVLCIEINGAPIGGTNPVSGEKIQTYPVSREKFRPYPVSRGKFQYYLVFIEG